jgi:hypothetical protein
MSWRSASDFSGKQVSNFLVQFVFDNQQCGKAQHTKHQKQHTTNEMARWKQTKVKDR